MTIEGLGKKFEEARRARNLTLDEAARMTKIRLARLAEIEADDFSQFPSLAYAKGFLLIYGKFLDVDVTPYLEAFEDSESVTVDGYSYLQENRPEKPASAPVVPRRPAVARSNRISPMPLIVGVVVLVIGFLLMKLVLNVQRLAPPPTQSTTQTSPSVSPALASKATTPAPAGTSPSGVASGASVAPANPSPAESGEQTQVAIRPLKRTYVRVTVGDEKGNPAFERWVSPTDGPVEFRGKHIAIRVLDREAVNITKNGKALEESDADVTVN